MFFEVGGCCLLADLVSDKHIELEHPLPPLTGLHPHPPPLPDGGRLEGVVVREIHKELDTELVYSVDHRHL